jgi:hypothetical protein
LKSNIEWSILVVVVVKMELVCKITFCIWSWLCEKVPTLLASHLKLVKNLGWWFWAKL